MLNQSPISGPRERQFRSFINDHFEMKDLVEIRAIVSHAKTSRVVERMFVEAAELLNHYPQLTQLNRQRANIYFGVNPRNAKKGTKNGIEICRHIWADFDNLTIDAVLDRILPILPLPTTVIHSGHGIHTYWRLDPPVSIETDSQRMEFESMLKALYADLDSDSTHDVTRLLRLPGFDNMKAEPMPCTILASARGTGFSPIQFARWRRSDDDCQALHFSRKTEPEVTLSNVEGKRVRGLVHYLDEPTHDRSRRDFGVVCGLLRLGMADAEIWNLVQGRSKFATGGRTYFDTTIENARKAVHR